MIYMVMMMSLDGTAGCHFVHKLPPPARVCVSSLDYIKPAPRLPSLHQRLLNASILQLSRLESSPHK